MNPNKQVRNERRMIKTMKQVEMPPKWMIRRPPCPRTTPMSKKLNKPVGELRLGADDNASTLATHENPAKKLMYITNMPECTLETSEKV